MNTNQLWILNLFTITASSSTETDDLVKYFNLIDDYYRVSITAFTSGETYYIKDSDSNKYTQVNAGDAFNPSAEYYQKGDCIRAQGYTYAQFELAESTQITLSYIGDYKDVKIFAAQSIRDRLAEDSDNGRDKALLGESFYNLITETTDSNGKIFNKDGIFNYTYRNEENDNNPLEAKNFFNQNHIYNQNTIGKITTEDVLDNITVLNMGMW